MPLGTSFNLILSKRGEPLLCEERLSMEWRRAMTAEGLSELQAAYPSAREFRIGVDGVYVRRYISTDDLRGGS
jgi:hypothetical protein